MVSESSIIVDFNLTNENKASLGNWQIVGDSVMGGRSTGDFIITDQGNGVFQGEVSLENNGGFSLLRYKFQEIKVMPLRKVVLRLKGDGKSYQFRIKTNSSDRHAYVSSFPTSGKWETIELSMPTLKAKYRGRDLDIPNFNNNYLSEIGFLIGNKKAEKFQLKICSVYLE